MAKPNKKDPSKTINIYCNHSSAQLFRYRKGDKDALVSCYKERVVDDYTKVACECPEC